MEHPRGSTERAPVFGTGGAGSTPAGGTKTCPKCGEDKALTEFPINRSRRDGRGSVCLICQRRYVSDHYRKDPEYYKKKAKDQQNRLREFVRSLKQGPCDQCGMSYPYYVMQFDHREGADKLFELGSSQALTSMKRILEEVAKCDLVCANCHAARTWLRNNMPS